MSRMVVLAALMMGCGGSPQETTSGKAPAGSLVVQAADVVNPVAVVGGASIGEEALRQMADRTRPADGKVHTAEERKQLVDDMITDEVLFQKAIAEGLYHDQKVRKILTNLLLRQEVYGKVTNADFAEEELRAYYDEHKEEFVVPEKVQAKRVVVNIAGDEAAAKAKADKIRADLVRDPESFAKVATSVSDGPYKRRGGDLGFVAREGKPGVEPEVVERAFSQKLDVVGEPFKAGEAFHILLVVNKRDRVERSFEQMKGSVLRMVKQEKFEKLRDDYIREAKAATTIELDQKKLDGLDLTRRTRFGSDPSAPGQPGGARDGHAHGADDGHGH